MRADSLTTTFIGCLLILLAAQAAAETAAGNPAPAAPVEGTLVVTLTGMKSDDGSLVYAMWSGPEGWLEANAVREGTAPITDGTVTLRFDALPYGEYAISAYHDANDNGRIDTGMFRVPKEPLGTSNDPRIRFGPPKYEDAAFILDQQELSIQIPVRKLFEKREE